VWGLANLYVSDGSVCPTQGAANPALTIMALASRLAEHLGSCASHAV
jgi:choline dehydrogenase-like flavoprotein